MSQDSILDGLASCDKWVLHWILLNEDLFEKPATNPKRDYLIKPWFRAIEELNSAEEVERAVRLCSRVRSAISLQVACAFYGLELQPSANGLLLCPHQKARAHWAKSFRHPRPALDDLAATRQLTNEFDTKEWQW